jgi:hypothetical protein
MWDSTVNLQWMPREYITWWFEVGYRHSDVPYFAGRGGVTPPGGNQGAPGSIVPGWTPDLVRSEDRVTLALLIKM